MKKKRIQWHPGFCAAMKLELRLDSKVLEYHQEYNLNSKPLQVDLLVIKKPADYTVSSRIGQFFRGHNILEFKSPKDDMNIDTYYKVIAYACLYKAYESKVDSIKTEDVSITLVRSKKPSKLFTVLEKEGHPITEVDKGIYVVGCSDIFVMQFVITDELDKDEHLWLKSLTDSIDTETAEELVTQAQSFNKGDKILAESVLDVVVKSNPVVFDEVKEDTKMCEALMELMAPEIEESILLAKVEAYLDTGMSRQDIVKTIVKKNNISKTEAMRLVKKCRSVPA